KDIYQKSHDQARGLKTERVPIIFINKYFTQFIPGKQESYATTTESLPFFDYNTPFPQPLTPLWKN
ncbi:hypothetical protein, partial [Microcystis sp. LE19-59.1C]|uniref:hypothetical protein n=1 Tax=Microcystis sp. LE19-59.1C TaxID=3016442 RepID=UPI0022C49AB1